ncbi:MAG: bleomycin resistance protein [Sneathiella sp.]|jgi:PhnB protein|uniref:VOC family protein n=1 Tax=Sneathiella sp. TaxID=1964365 RepID=UPI000C4FD8FD|nr:VOC family protein [Sneathiella sp.]MAL78765.1 bleomycin resistance protein [Sneathiella sp.]|tara:strand:- start:105 stop:527 length:423 start_codon:yes stop_codon:yes gene_type:complete
MEPTIYLFFKGNCLEAMTHYAEVLGGEIGGVFRNGDVPDPESRMPGGDDMVMNMAITLGSATVMASDNSEDMYDKPQGFRISIAPTSRAEFDRIHAALAKEAQSIEMAPEETFWAERFAMFTDRYGTPWMLNFTGAKAPD